MQVRPMSQKVEFDAGREEDRGPMAWGYRASPAGEAAARFTV